MSGSEFHRRCFDAWGPFCYWCYGIATDAAHIIGRAKLGKHRYAEPVMNSRPACRTCHRAQTDNKLEFALADRLMAVAALNKHLTIPLPVPEK